MDGRSEFVLGRFRSWSARIYPINHQPSSLLPTSLQSTRQPPTKHSNNTLTFVFHFTIPHSLLSFLVHFAVSSLSACADSRLPSALSINPTPPPPISEPRTPAPPGLRILIRRNNNNDSLRGTGRSGSSIQRTQPCTSPVQSIHSQELSQIHLPCQPSSNVKPTI